MNDDFAQSLAEVSVQVARKLPDHRPAVCVELALLCLAGKLNHERLVSYPLGEDSQDLGPYQVAVGIAAAVALAAPSE